MGHLNTPSRPGMNSWSVETSTDGPTMGNPTHNGGHEPRSEPESDTILRLIFGPNSTQKQAQGEDCPNRYMQLPGTLSNRCEIS